MTPRRVLIIAEAANPEWTSVPLVGWSLATALMRRDDIDAHLVTHIRNRDALLRAGLVEGEQFTAIDSDAIAAPLYKVATVLRGGKGKGWTTVTALAALSYYYFEHKLWQQFGDEIKAGRYDLIHRVTPLSPTIPGLIARRCAKAGVPLFVGPLNGGVPWPKAFDAARRKEREWLSYIRGLYKLLPGYRSLRKHATTIFIASRDTWKQMPEQYHDKCVYLPENAIDPTRLPTAQRGAIGNPVKVIFVGRLVPYKGADMLIEAAAPLLREGKIELTIAGDGPQREELDALVERLGIARRIQFAGWIEHRHVMQLLSESDVFAFPSIREFGGGVVLEAMAVGCVPIVVDYGGPGELVTDDTGFKVPIGPREPIIQQLHDRLRELADNPAMIAKRRQPATERVADQFTWDAKAGLVAAAYRKVVDASPIRPERYAALTSAGQAT